MDLFFEIYLILVIFYFDAAKEATDITRNYAKNSVDKKIDMFYKKRITGEVSGVTPTKNAIKDVIKAIKFLKNRGILLKERNEENY